jgi:hypothetical protein
MLTTLASRTLRVRGPMNCPCLAVVRWDAGVYCFSLPRGFGRRLSAQAHSLVINDHETPISPVMKGITNGWFNAESLMVL